MEYNNLQVKLETPKYQREKAPKVVLDDSDLKMCGKCKGFYGNSFLSRHLKVCQRNECAPTYSLPIGLLLADSPVNITQEFKVHILGKLRDDNAGILCKSDRTILIIGMRLYDKVKRKVDKSSEVRKPVRTDMRRIAHLYIPFKNQPDITHVYSTAQDLFDRRNVSQLQEALDTYCEKEKGGLKSGLKIALLYLIKKSAKIIKGTVLMEAEEGVTEEEARKRAVSKAQEIDLFLVFLKLWEDSMFGDAVYLVNKNRQIRLRKPAALPLEEDVKMLSNHVKGRMKALLNDPFVLFYSHAYVHMKRS